MGHRASTPVLVVLVVMAGACGGPPAGDRAGRDAGGPAPVPNTRPGDPARALFVDACGPCHDPSGSGRPGQGPELRASPFLSAPPDVLIRIVLDGVRSDDADHVARYALPMPSWRVLQDDELAAMVTFVRREWGSDTSPVTAADVAAVRSATSGRSRPWTHSEILDRSTAGRAR